MARLTTVGSRVQPVGQRLQRAPTLSEKRITGRTLQDRRLRIWTRDPHCAKCGRLVEFPHGFELDHVEALANGGADTDENSQVLCIGPDGCHEAKTRVDLGQRPRQREGVGQSSRPRRP